MCYLSVAVDWATKVRLSQFGTLLFGCKKACGPGSEDLTIQATLNPQTLKKLSMTEHGTVQTVVLPLQTGFATWLHPGLGWGGGRRLFLFGGSSCLVPQSAAARDNR